MANFPKPAGPSTIWANAGTRADPGDAKTNIGWVVETPPFQQQNWVDWKQDSFIAHVNQHGVAVWDAVTEYQGNLSYTKGSNGIIYKCLVTNTNIDPVNPLNSTYWKQAFEDYGSVAVVSNALAAHIANYQTLAGLSSAGAARNNLAVYSKTETDARYAALLGSSANAFNVAAATQPSHAVPLSQLSSVLTQATESVAGVMAIATNAKAAAGVDDLTAITPLKGATVYLMKTGNLSGLANVATARANLGLGSMAVESATAFLRASNNLSDLTSAAAARANLGLTSTATWAETYFLRAFQNLADVPDKATARNNLGLGSAATLNINNFLQPGYSLSDVASVPAARANLGLGSASTLNIDNFLQPGFNLSDVPNKQAGRNNLGLGNAATRNVYGAGGGDLDFTAVVTGATNYMRLPNGIITQFGSAHITTNTRINFQIPMNVGSIQITIGEANDPNQLRGRTAGVGNVDTNGFYASGVVGNAAATLLVYWTAHGWA